MKSINILPPILLLFAIALTVNHTQAQCCAGASPIAGGSNLSLLERGQLEISPRYQYSYGDETYRGDTANDISLFTKVFNHYAYLNVGYGLSDNLSFYAALGYYPAKTEMLVRDTISGKGIGALVLFPKYKVLDYSNNNRKTELTLGFGMKIPLGEFDQSRVIFVNPVTGEEFSIINSPATQPSTGTNDFIFNLQFLQAYPKKTFYFSSNITYIMRGTNPIGQNFGDIVSASISTGKNIFKWLGVAAAVKAEKTDSLVDATWLSTQKNTGYKKLAIVPSINFIPASNLTITASLEYPIYQYVTGVQIATKFIALISLNYRMGIIPKQEETIIRPEGKTIVPN